MPLSLRAEILVKVGGPRGVAVGAVTLLVFMIGLLVICRRTATGRRENLYAEVNYESEMVPIISQA